MAYFDLFRKGKSIFCDDDMVQMLVTSDGTVAIVQRNGNEIGYQAGEWDQVQAGNPWLDRSAHEMTVIAELDTTTVVDEVIPNVALVCTCGWLQRCITVELDYLHRLGENHLKQVREQQGG